MTIFFKQLGRFSVLDGLLYPLHVLFFVALFLRSILRTYVSRKVSWRGRDVSTRRPPPRAESER
jgi:4,4'-diaponeurosporenoate glycosyltransferase